MLAKVYVVRKPSHNETLQGVSEALLVDGVSVVGIDANACIFAAGLKSAGAKELKDADPARLSVSVQQLPQGA